MDDITSAVSQYIQDMGISVLRIAEKTGLKYGAIYPSLCPNPTRKLRADEFIRICAFLGVDPTKFKTPQKCMNTNETK